MVGLKYSLRVKVNELSTSKDEFYGSDSYLIVTGHLNVASVGARHNVPGIQDHQETL